MIPLSSKEQSKCPVCVDLLEAISVNEMFWYFEQCVLQLQAVVAIIEGRWAHQRKEKNKQTIFVMCLWECNLLNMHMYT